jgi:hypothetical protein
MIVQSEPAFGLGRLTATPGALTALAEAEVQIWMLASRHVAGDFGDVDDDDRRANEAAIRDGDRILSSYRLPTGVEIWLLTEADRSATTALLPSEY